MPECGTGLDKIDTEDTRYKIIREFLTEKKQPDIKSVRYILNCSRGKRKKKIQDEKSVTDFLGSCTSILSQEIHLSVL